MKLKLIKTEGYLLIADDSEIKEGDYCYYLNKLGGGHITCQAYVFDNEMLYDDGTFNRSIGEGITPALGECKKIIAHLPLNNSPVLEGVPLLPPLEQQDDVEKLAEEYGENIGNKNGTAAFDYKRGYNKAKEKYLREIDKQISDFKHDLKECTSNYIKQNCEGAIFGLTRLQQSISQPKMPTHFECVMETIVIGHDGHQNIFGNTIKTTTNSQGQIQIKGKYIYES